MKGCRSFRINVVYIHEEDMLSMPQLSWDYQRLATRQAASVCHFIPNIDGSSESKSEQHAEPPDVARLPVPR